VKLLSILSHHPRIVTFHGMAVDKAKGEVRLLTLTLRLLTLTHIPFLPLPLTTV
jgi:hypothetical protein